MTLDDFKWGCICVQSYLYIHGMSLSPDTRVWVSGIFTTSENQSLKYGIRKTFPWHFNNLLSLLFTLMFPLNISLLNLHAFNAPVRLSYICICSLSRHSENYAVSMNLTTSRKMGALNQSDFVCRMAELQQSVSQMLAWTEILFWMAVFSSQWDL